VAAETPFDAASDERIFRLGASDLTAIIVLPGLLARLRQEAPRCRLVLREGDHLRMPAMLENGDVSAVLGYLGDGLAANARQRVLGRMEWVTVRDPATPEIASLDEFCARPHAMVTPAGDLHGMVDDALAAMGRSRTVAIGVASFAMLLPALRGTDLIAAVPAPFARRMAELGGMAVGQLPIRLPVAPHAIAWTAAADRDPAERWFRAVVLACYQKELTADPGAG
jgi:LysR family transcriptional activator of mexEF-oprN operon